MVVRPLVVDLSLNSIMRVEFSKMFSYRISVITLYAKEPDSSWGLSCALMDKTVNFSLYTLNFYFDSLGMIADGR